VCDQEPEQVELADRQWELDPVAVRRMVVAVDNKVPVDDPGGAGGLPLADATEHRVHP